jgi:transposase
MPRWTLKRLVDWIKESFGVECCRETVRKALKKLGYSWKKWRKLLNKADIKAREAFVEKLAGILKQATEGERLVIYIDEAHIHLDTDEGYGWTVKGKRAWISSTSPGLAKVSFYGVYLYNLGQVRLFPYLQANGDNTVDVLKKIRNEFPDEDITLIWDGASYHRGEKVIHAIEKLDITLEPLPAYSPDFMPVEHLWHWLREDVTYHQCYNDELELIAQVQKFEQEINAIPTAVADRLWTKTVLDLEEEKLRFSE